MEYVSRLPNEIFGTIHGPGYNGGGLRQHLRLRCAGYRRLPHVHRRVGTGSIVWYVDGIQYHQADPSRRCPGRGSSTSRSSCCSTSPSAATSVAPSIRRTAFPQEYLVDYVRVYQGPDTAERFETSFSDDSVGWQEVSIPISRLRPQRRATGRCAERRPRP